MSESATFASILFPGDTGPPADGLDEPGVFRDLNLDQIVASITAGRELYRLKPFFYARLTSVDAIHYRHEVLRDLELPSLRKSIGSFAEKMRHMRDCLTVAARLHYRYQKERLFLDAVLTYSEAVRSLADDLRPGQPRPGGPAPGGPASRGLLACWRYLAAYAESGRFTELAAQASELDDALSRIRYTLRIKGSRIRVSRYDDEPDYSSEVRETFKKFKQGDVSDYRTRFTTLLEMDHVEDGILQLVARLYPEVFEALGTFCQRYAEYADAVVVRFDQEVQFYLACLDYLEPLRAAGLSFCYPVVSAESKDVSASGTFDLALAGKLVPQRVPVVGNDFELRGAERLLVVTGPNQGGKTTLARTFGQLHYLASIGCLVPGREARLFLCDGLLTHFEREEDLDTLSGKLQDDLVRIRRVLDQATGRSVIILNEIFTSTTPADALYLSRRVLRQIADLDALCVCVTFLDELAAFSPATVSMVAMIVPDDPALRTFKVVRRPADGFAYAAAIAEKYGLSYDRVKARVTA